MTKDQIERYGGICDQIIALRAVKVRDTVQGSTSEIPYQKHTIQIEGGAEHGKSRKILELQRQKAEIEAAIEAIPKKDGTNKAIITMRVLGRMNWNDIAANLGYCFTKEGVRKAYKRAIKKYF